MNLNLLDPFIEAVRGITMMGVAVYQNGHKIAGYQWEPEYRTNQYSISKSYTSTAVGLLISEGKMNLDDAVKKYLNAYWPKVGDVSALTMERLERMTIRHLLTMTLGHEKASLMSTEKLQMTERDWVSYSLRQPLVSEPGASFVYTNAGPYLAAVIVQEITGMSLVDYLMPRLFEPLGSFLPTWERDPSGRDFGSSGLSLSLSEIADFGQLYLQKGQWQGKQLIPASWVEEAQKTQINSNPMVAGSSDYGLCFWKGPHNSYRSDGKYGQYSIVLPEKNAVVAINAFNRGQLDIRACVWQHIYPQL